VVASRPAANRAAAPFELSQCGFGEARFCVHDTTCGVRASRVDCVLRIRTAFQDRAGHADERGS
jgi:hypothetical protein